MNVLATGLHASGRCISGKIGAASTVRTGIEINGSGVNDVVVIDRDLLDAV